MTFWPKLLGLKSETDWKDKENTFCELGTVPDILCIFNSHLILSKPHEYDIIVILHPLTETQRH